MARKHLLSQLAHVEILTPKLEESVTFFKELMGMEVQCQRLSQLRARLGAGEVGAFAGLELDVSQLLDAGLDAGVVPARPRALVPRASGHGRSKHRQSL